MGVFCCKFKPKVLDFDSYNDFHLLVSELTLFWRNLKLRKANPSKLQDSIKNKSKINHDGQLVANGFKNDFLETYLLHDEYKDRSIYFFKGLYEKYEKETKLPLMKYFFLSLFFLTCNKYINSAKRFFRIISQLFKFKVIENEKNVVFYEREFLINLTKFYVNLISLESVNCYFHVGSESNNNDELPQTENPDKNINKDMTNWETRWDAFQIFPIISSTSKSQLESAFSLANQNIFVNQLFEKKFSNELINLDNFWTLYPVLSNDEYIRDSLIETYAENLKNYKSNIK